MKRTNDAVYFLTPQAEGWAVWRDAQRLHIATTLAEALGLLPAASPFEFAVPCHPLITERLRLPAAERDELASMVQLQWEKSLPYSPEEITGSFTVVETTNGESIIWSVAAAQEAWREYGDIWSKANRWPVRLAPYVSHVAAACPEGKTVLVVYVEQGHWVVAVVEDRRPGWVHVMSASDAQGFAGEFPSLMLTMGLEDVPTGFARVLLSPEVTGCAATLEAATPAPVEVLPLVTPVAHLEIDLLPAQWQSTARRHRDSRAWRKGAMIAAAVYLLIVAAAAVDLFVLHRRVAGLEADLNAQRPALSLLQSRQARFNSLAAAIDSHRYAVELLFLLNRCLPEQSVHFTEFDQMPQQWRIVGEAPTPGLATEYLLRLKHDPDLSGCDISADPPRLLADGRAQFQVVGKP